MAYQDRELASGIRRIRDVAWYKGVVPTVVPWNWYDNRLSWNLTIVLGLINTVPAGLGKSVLAYEFLPVSLWKVINTE